MTKVTNAYFAGFFDGEGYIGVTYQEAFDAYMIRASVTNNNCDVLKLFKHAFGGKITAPKHYGIKAGKSAWVWTVHGRELIVFLTAISEFVVVKKPQVDLALQFPFGGRGTYVRENIQSQREYIYFRLKEMKGESVTLPVDADYENDNDAWHSDPMVVKAVELHQDGKTQEEVAQILGVKQARVGYWLRQTGNARSRRVAGVLAGQKRQDGPKSPEAQQAAELYQAGVPISQIAKQLEAKPTTVNYWLRRKGLTRSYKEAQQLRRGRERESFD